MSSECSSGGDVCGEGEENSVPTAVVDISFVSLVAERGRREDGDGVMREEEEEQTGIKNFKRFRKVCTWRLKFNTFLVTCTTHTLFSSHLQ